MDTGFGAVLERFEKAFGKHITNFVLALIGIATAVFCGSVIWTLALGPAVTWLSAISLDDSWLVPALSVVTMGSSFAAGFWIVWYVGLKIERSHAVRAARDLGEARRKLSEDQRALEERVGDFERRLAKAEKATPKIDPI